MWLRNAACVTVTMTLLVTTSLGYPSGAPTNSCISMYPRGHGVAPQNSNPPFTLTLSQTVYNVNVRTPINVTITASSGTNFKGVFLQARTISNCSQTVGTFQIPASMTDFQLLRCQSANDAVTHRSNASKSMASFFWMPPSSSMGAVYVRATVVQAFTQFWNTLKSDVIYENTSSSANVTCPLPKTVAEAQALDTQTTPTVQTAQSTQATTTRSNASSLFSFGHFLIASLFAVIGCLPVY